MKHARLVNGTVIDISEDPLSEFHEILSEDFVEVPDNVTVGSILTEEGEWLIKEVVPRVAPPRPLPFLTPIQFKMCFTPDERRVIAEIKLNDHVLQDAYEILDDPRLTEVDLNLQSVRDTVTYIKDLGIINDDRCREVLLGIMK